jgi:hypothetical protein
MLNMLQQCIAVYCKEKTLLEQLACGHASQEAFCDGHAPGFAKLCLGVPADIEKRARVSRRVSRTGLPYKNIMSTYNNMLIELAKRT